MNSGRAPSPSRAMLFYSTSLLLLSTIGGYLQWGFGLWGNVVNELAFFMGLAVFFGVYVEWQPFRGVFRLRLLSWGGIFKCLVLGILAMALTQVLGVLVVFAVERLGGTMDQPHAALAKAPYLVALLVGALLPAIAEEIAFRGYIQWALKPLGTLAAPLVTGLLFGAMHGSLIRLVPLALLGVLFAVAVQRSGSILPGIIMHFLNNGILLTLAAFLTPGSQVPGLAPVPEGAPWASVALLAAVAVALGLACFALVRRFGPQDLKAPPAETVGPEAGAVASEAGAVASVDGRAVADGAVSGRRLAAVLLPLLPGVGVYALSVWQELGRVFGH